VSLTSAPIWCWWVECEGCGVSSQERGSHNRALETALDDGWLVEGNRHTCPDCQSLAHRELHPPKETTT
jgi:hypothetical protein